MSARRWLMPVILACAATTPARGGDLVGDFFDLSVARLPQLPRTDPALEVIFGEEEAFVGLTPTQQMAITRQRDDPLLAIPLVAIRTGRGEVRDYVIELDFTDMLVNLPPLGFPLELFVSDTTFWFDDLELLDEKGNATRRGLITNIVLIGSPGDDGMIEIGDPLRFADGNGVDAPMLSDPDGTGFGEVLVLRLPDGAAVANYPILRIEFDMIAGDFDRDGDVDLADYMELSRCFTGPAMGAADECLFTDLDGDGDVDLADVLIFLDAFTGAGGTLAVASAR